MVALPIAPDLILEKDDALRKLWFGSQVMRHPAKQNIYQLMHLSKRFAVPGGVALDPFCGSGTSMLLASPLYGGMDVLGVELAPHFFPLQQSAWDRWQCSIEMQSLYEISDGDFIGLPGDSRDLVNVIARANGEALGIAGLIVTSPPYQDVVSNQSNQTKRLQEKEARSGKPVFKVKPGPNSQGIVDHAYSAMADNIGNLRGKKYLESMRLVWEGCAAVLKPGGILCCITRDCIKKQQRVPVGEQNRDLLIAAGLEFIEREVWYLSGESFWRKLYRQKYPDAPVIDTEDVWIFRKPLERERAQPTLFDVLAS